MRCIFLCCIMALLPMITTLGMAQTDEPPIVNLMISTDVPPSRTDEQGEVTLSNLDNLKENITDRDLIATIFSTQDFMYTRGRLLLIRLGLDSKFELGMSGLHSGEKLSKLSRQDQKNLLETSKLYVEKARICGKNMIIVYGFMPQSFDQNEDTFDVLDDLGLQYDAGFQAGIIFAPGHEKDVWPYPVNGHEFYAVPVSTYDLSGKKVVLQDSYFKDNGMSASQWYDALVAKLDQIQGKDEPLVISLNTSISGSGDYLDALNNFMDYAISKKASFVTTIQLVEMAKTGERDVSKLPANLTSTQVCIDCEEEEEDYLKAAISVTSINDTSASNSTT